MPYGYSELEDKNDAVNGAAAGQVAQGVQAPIAGMQPGQSPSAGNQSGQSYADFLQGGTPTQTGFLNFDSFAGANGQEARNSAQRLNESTANAAQKAKQGVYDINNDYQNALEAGGAAEKQRDFKDVDAGLPDWMKDQWKGDSHLVGGPGSSPPNTTGTDSQALTGDPNAMKPDEGTKAPQASPPGNNSKTSPPASGAPGSGGAAGPVYPPGTTPPAAPPPMTPADWGNANKNAAFPQGAPTMNGNNTGQIDPNDEYRNMLQRGANTTYTGPTGLSEDPRYQQAGADVRNAQRGLDATGSEAGLAAASGGTSADAALMNQQGQQAFGQTRDAYGNLNKFAGDVDANATKQGERAKYDADQSAASYQMQLGQYDKQKTDEKAAADAKAAQDAIDNKAPKSFDDYVNGKDDEHTMTSDESGKRTTWANTDNIANWHLGSFGPGHDARLAAEEFMKQEGVPEGDDRQSTFDDFMKSIPEGMKNYINGMIEENSPIVGAIGGGAAPANKPEDWSWFNGVFNAYLKKKGKEK